MKVLPTLACACALLSASLSHPLHADEKDVARMLEGVKLMPPTGYPGWIAVVGPAAFPVVVGREGGLDQTVVAAADFGAGRVVLFGHNG